VALAWLLARPGVTSPILGARTLAQIEDNLGALEVILDADATRRLEAASAITLGFPHDFIASDMVRGIVAGGTTIERRGG
jgi:diketogulonate reductase-like aldo/keto reductase